MVNEAGLNGLDYTILALVGVGAVSGLTRGALRMATSILSLVLGVYAASIYYGRAAALAHRYAATGPAMSAVIGYAAVLVMVFIVVEYAGATVMRLVQIIHLSWIDRLAGAALGASIGAVAAGFAVLGLTALLPPNPAILRDSKLAPQVLGYNQVLMAYVPPQVKNEFEEKRAELYRHWVLEARSAANGEGPEPSASPTR
jgi:uncharacterized membrane protein required for colicin V production